MGIQKHKLKAQTLLRFCCSTLGIVLNLLLLQFLPSVMEGQAALGIALEKHMKTFPYFQDT